MGLCYLAVNFTIQQLIRKGSIMSELLRNAADLIKTDGALMGSRWRNCEAEVIAAQTIAACARNFKDHGEAISWLGKGALLGRQQCGTNNAHGLNLLLQDGMIVMEVFTGTLQPSKPDDIAMKDGKYLVLRCTEKLLLYVISYLGK